MRKSLFTFFVLLSLTSVLSGQYAEFKEPILIDEFGPLSGNCDPGVRIDNGIISAYRHKGSRSIVIYYRGADELPDALNRPPRTLRKMQNHLFFRGIDPALVTFVNGGWREKETYRIWIVLEGGMEPVPSGTIPEPADKTDSTFLFGRGFVEDNYSFRSWESIEKDRIQNGEQYVIQEQLQETDSTTRFDWASNSFSNYLSRHKGHTGYLIFYADSKLSSIEKVRTEIELGRNKIADSSGIERERIQIVFGGFKESWLIEVESWIKGKNSPMPVPSPNPVDTESEIVEDQ